jgi:hypothetical protein
MRETEKMIEPNSNLQRRSLNHVLYLLAKQYIDSANALEDRMVKTRDSSTAPGVILCLSFSIELILKCLLIVDKDEIRTIRDVEEAGIDLRGHDYLELFERIEAPYKEIILQQLARRDPSIRTIESLKAILAAIGSDPFTFWRYVYEKDQIPSFNLRAFKGFGGSLWDAITEIRTRRAAR